MNQILINNSLIPIYIMKKLFIILIITGLTLPMTAQILPFLEKGKSGASINIGSEMGYGFNGFIAGAGVSINSVIDVEASYFRTNFDKQKLGLTGTSPSSDYVEAHFTLWLLKSRLAPYLDLYVGANPVVFNSNYHGYEYPDGTNTATYIGNTGGALGLVSNLVFRTNNNWLFMPFYRVHYMFSKDRIEKNLVQTSETSNSCGVSYGISLGKMLGKMGTVYLSLKAYDNTNNSRAFHDITLGYVVPF